MATKKFVISWFASAIIMFIFSYLWHGVMLNDVSMLRYPFGLFLLFASIVYLIAGAVLAKAFTLEIFSRFAKHPFLKGLIVGAICGVLLYIISIVVEVSYTKNLSREYMLIDICWQMIEQAIGGLVVGLVHVFVWDDSMIRPEDLD